MGAAGEFIYKIKAFYVQESQSLLDDELLDDVGFSLYSRCESILEYTRVFQGRVKCKRRASAGLAADGIWAAEMSVAILAVLLRSLDHGNIVFWFDTWVDGV